MELAPTSQETTCSRSGVDVTDTENVVVARNTNGPEFELQLVDSSTTSLMRHSDTNEHFPDGGLRSWLVVLGSSLLVLASYGLMNSVGVLQSHLETHQLASYTSSTVGWVPGLYMFMMLAGGVFVGPLFDTYGPKALVIAGSTIYVVALFLTAECTQYWQFILSFGIMAGIGSALVSTVALACVPHWFQARIGMAMGTALVGAGLGGVVFPFLLKASFARFGFRWGMRILAFVILAACGMGSFLVKSRLPKGDKLKTAIDARCFKDSRFSLLTVGIWFLELETFALLGLFPTYVVALGFSVNTSVNLLVVLNICSVIGRLVAGRVGDMYGRLNTLLVLVSFGILAIFIILYPFSHSMTALYFFSALYGLSSGSFLSLAPVCIRQVSPAKEIGMRFGTCYALVSFA
ncbi:MFS general substrate transporter [Aspergillus fijiensis CBS 313.89]|uniref:MFS general substrate transporter n=1 Tax=Aspergillus fijiensis CBS 313.89 TaxID=1448319 RepID=A0A8G1W0U7_9EURO|nr:MFS general substrate transporter [Aspergillus fijiensis CBS 313.89]RAK78963.1 MFS general substrate transporter [Aspergillus fijiensis CBS 313.89]